MGYRTAMSGSVSQSKDSPSRSLDMIERPLMSPDELKMLPKGTFIVTKTGFHPIKVKLKLFFEWGIEFEHEPYTIPVRDTSTVKYANKDDIMAAIKAKYKISSKKERFDEGNMAVAIYVEQHMDEQRWMAIKEKSRKIAAQKRMNETVQK